MLKKILSIFAVLLGIFVFFALIFLIIHFFGIEDNRKNVESDASTIIYMAELKYYSEAMNGMQDKTVCYNIAELNYKNHGLLGKRKESYIGSVLIGGDINNPTIKIWISDGESYLAGNSGSLKANYSKETATATCEL